ncbi:unnamed protein product, partial [Mesorhabditis belari]|uniref:Uncharacterized protein n=1 Tax=Mesorhabditis belari TaxID=2138241 RepID=A0AAF3EYH6_9BILA
MRLLLLCSILVIVECANKKSKKKVEAELDEEPVEFWISNACSAYDRCLSKYDSLINACGDERQFRNEEPSDSCYQPIAKLFTELVSRKQKRAQLLRDCYVTGHVESVDDSQFEKASAKKRHQATCIRKIAEFDQYFYGEDVKEVKRRAKTKNQCRAIAKRFKDRCSRIESCCIRVKTCRALVARHPLVESMKEMEDRIKEERRQCRQGALDN